MPTFTNIYQETRGIKTSGRRLKRNWRSMKARIIKEEKARYQIELANEIFTKMNMRVFYLQSRSDNGAELPKLEASTLEWRLANNYKGDKKLQMSGNLRKNFKLLKSIIIDGNKITIVNEAKNSRGQEYAKYLNATDPRNGKRWVNLDIPKECLPGGFTREQLLKNYKKRLQTRFSLELYKKR